MRIYATIQAFFEIIFQNDAHTALIKAKQPAQLSYCAGC